MLHLVLGKQGSGKTLFVIMKAYEYFKRGYTIYSNVALNFPYKKLNYNDIINCKLKNAIVIIDEVHQLLPARASMREINRLICDSFLSMIRKQGLEVFGTSQTDRKVDVRFIEECDYVYVCSKFALVNGKFSPVIITENLARNIPIIIDVEIKETFSGKCIKTHFLGNGFFDLYDTEQIIRIV